MRHLSYHLRSQKNVEHQPDPFVMLLEMDKRGWYRLKYHQKTASFHEEATLSGPGANTARILFVEEDTGTEGSLIIEQGTGSGTWILNGVITDDHGGYARIAERMVVADSPGMTFRFARNLEDIVYEGETYYAFPCSVGQTHYGSEKFPTLDVVVGNPDRIPEAWVRKANGFIGEKVRVKLVWAGDL